MNAAIFLFRRNLFQLKCHVFYNAKSNFIFFVKNLFFVFFRTLSANSLAFGRPCEIPFGYFFGHSQAKRSFLKIQQNR